MQPAKLIRLRKQLENYSLDKEACGLPSFFSYDRKTGQIKDFIACRNKILYSGADVMAQCLIGNPDYAVNTMYLEFNNNPGGMSVTPPAFDRTIASGMPYYTGLSGVEDVDFLRVPLTVNALISSSDTEKYAGNQATFFAISEGNVGRWGKSFSNGSGVYGAALVAAPDAGDPTKDVVFSRVYTGINTIFKEAGFDVGVTWAVRYN